MNICILKGNLTSKPELKVVGQYNTALAIFTIAVNEKTKQGEKTHFFDCKAFAKTAENIGKYFDKGKPILIQGSLNQETWETKEGQKRSKVTVSVYKFDFVGAPQKSEPKVENEEVF